MANIKKTKDDALAIINAALTILDRYPEFDETNTNLSYNTSTNPFTFLMDIFKSTAGYNVFLKIISSFLVLELPVLELAVKGIILSNLKNILSCSLNPYISYDILMNGIVFEVDEISYYPKDTVTLSDEEKEKFQRLLDMLDEIDDVSNVYHNVEL